MGARWRICGGRRAPRVRPQVFRTGLCEIGKRGRSVHLRTLADLPLAFLTWPKMFVSSGLRLVLYHIFNYNYVINCSCADQLHSMRILFKIQGYWYAPSHRQQRASPCFLSINIFLERTRETLCVRSPPRKMFCQFLHSLLYVLEVLILRLPLAISSHYLALKFCLRAFFGRLHRGMRDIDNIADYAAGTCKSFPPCSPESPTVSDLSCAPRTIRVWVR